MLWVFDQSEVFSATSPTPSTVPLLLDGTTLWARMFRGLNNTDSLQQLLVSEESSRGGNAADVMMKSANVSQTL